MTHLISELFSIFESFRRIAEMKSRSGLAFDFSLANLLARRSFQLAD